MRKDSQKLSLIGLTHIEERNRAVLGRILGIAGDRSAYVLCHLNLVVPRTKLDKRLLKLLGSHAATLAGRDRRGS